MVRTKLDNGCRYSTPVTQRPPHPADGQFTLEASETQAPVTPATEPASRAGFRLAAAGVAGWLGWWCGLSPVPHLRGSADVRESASGRVDDEVDDSHPPFVPLR